MSGGLVLSGGTLTSALCEPNMADQSCAPDWLAVEPGGLAAERLHSWVAQQPVPVIGLACSDPRPFDLTVEDDAELKQVAAHIEANPRASAVLVQVLRSTGSLPLVEALAVESLAYATLQAGAEYRRWLSHRGEGASLGEVEAVRVSRVESRLEICLDTPERRNALSVPMRDGLTEAFKLAAMDESISHVAVRGNGPAFCAGGDLTEFSLVDDVSRTHETRQLRMPARYLALCAKKTSFFLHGACVGAGIELPAFARRVVAASDTVFRLPEVAMGLIPGAGGCVSIPRRIGRQRAAWMAITGAEVNAELALSWGLVDEVGDG